MFTKLEISSFRGITNKEFDLTKHNTFVGLNGAGKTSIIESIMFLLCGETLLWNKDLEKNINRNDLRMPINVTLTNENGKTFNRRYGESWKIPKGSTKEVYDGHFNDFYINGVKVKEQEYYNHLYEEFNIKYTKEIKVGVNRLNLVRSFIDPFYLGKTIDYKLFRAFITDLLELKSDAEILKNVEQYELIKPDMIKWNYDTNKLQKEYTTLLNSKDGYSTQIKTLQDQIKVLDNHYDSSKLDELKSELDSILYEKYIGIKEIDDLKAQKSVLSSELNESRINDLQEYKNAPQSELDTKISELSKELNNIALKGSKCKQEYKLLESNIKSQEENAQRIQRNIKDFQNSIDVLQKTSSDKNKIKQQICPNCGYVLNEDEVNASIEKFEKSKEKQIQLYSKNINDLENELNKLNDNLPNLKNDYKQKYDEIISLSNEYNTLKSKLTSLEEEKKSEDIKTKNLEDSQRTIDLKNKLIEVDKQLNELIEKDKECELSWQTEHNEKLKKAQDSYSLELSKKTNAIKAKEAQDTLDRIIKSKALTELKINILKNFILLKIKTIKDKSSEIFGDIEFVMLEYSKLTEDSVQECCYATKKGVEYQGVNTASMLKLGIEIIECIKRHLGVKNIPLIFDISDNIDYPNLKNIYESTDSQTFTTFVNGNDGIECKNEEEIINIKKGN